MQKVFSIAIDGPAGAGKSTIAKALAQSLDAMYLDTGAMYRAFGLYILRQGISTTDARAVIERVRKADIAVDFREGSQRVLLDGEDVSEAIRAPEVSQAASQISAVPEVRAHMVALQRRIAEGHSVVMDGRDIGTHVLPGATLKIYLTASVEVRARRRWTELREKGLDADYDQVLSDMIQRDYQDTHREASPLRPAADARRVDNSDLTLEQAVALIREMALDAIAQS